MGVSSVRVRIILLIIFLLPVSLFAQSETPKPDSYYTLLGKLQSVLSTGSIVSEQEFYGKHLLWVNARLGRVLRPVGLSRREDFQTEMVPDDNGIVLTVSVPFDPEKVQGFMPPFHDVKRGEFLFWCGAQGKEVISVRGSYGESFSRDILAKIFALTPSLPPEHSEWN